MGDRAAPRLLRGFAIGTLVAFVVVGAVLSTLLSRQIREREEKDAKFHSVFVIQSLLRDHMLGSDLEAPLDPAGARYRELAAFVRSRILQPPVVRIKVWSLDGTIVFSDEPALVGMKFPDEAEELAESANGTVDAGLSNLQADENVLERTSFSKLYETHVGITLEGADGPRTGVAEIYTDYGGIQAEVDRSARTLLVTLLGGLGVLYLLLLPIARRAGRLMARQNVRLEEQAMELRTLLETEQQRVEELRELNRLKDDFVAVASHEVRTPLTSIIGYAKTLQRPEFSEASEARTEFLRAIERQGQRLHHLVENLLTASHVRVDPPTVALAPVPWPTSSARSWRGWARGGVASWSPSPTNWPRS